MNKNFLIGAAAVIIIAAVGFAVTKHKNAAPEGDAAKTGDSSASATKPVIQITAGQAFLVSDSGEHTKELKSGDTLTPPAMIEVSAGGAASVSFADGSTARIDGGTTLTVNSADYDANSGKSNTSIFVKFGRVWSKVVELATPDSSWEVQSQTAVATVRGTAFDTNVTSDATIFAGSEHDVDVATIDPETRVHMEEQAATLGEGKMIEIKNSALADLVSGKARLALVAIAASEKNSAWFSGNERIDIDVNAIIKALQDQGATGAELRTKIRMKLRGETSATTGSASTGGDQTANNTTSGTSRGTLLDLWKSGKSEKCTFNFTYAQGSSEGTVYLADGKMRGDFKVNVTAAGVTNMAIESHMVRENDYTYVWTSASPVGFKMQTTGDLPGSIGNSGSFDYNQLLDYNCTGWSGGDATFALPAGVNFTALNVPAR
jgi:FecR protein